MMSIISCYSSKKILKINKIYSLKINALFQSSQGGIFFSTQLLLKIPEFELNIRFVFHRIRALDIQSIVEFL